MRKIQRGLKLFFFLKVIQGHQTMTMARLYDSQSNCQKAKGSIIINVKSRLKIIDSSSSFLKGKEIEMNLL